MKDPYIADILVNNMEIYKEQFTPRQSFGLFYAALRANYDKHVIYFFKHEYQKFETSVPNMVYSEIMRLARNPGSPRSPGPEPQSDPD